MRIFFISIWCLVFSAIAQVHASENSPQTNWGGVFKVQVEKIDPADINSGALSDLATSAERGD